MIKVIVMDMDGTLLNDENKISPRTKEVLMKAQQQGIRLVLASGRTRRRMLDYAHELEMEKYGGYLIFANGTGIYDLTTKHEERFSEMSIENQIEIYNCFKQYPVEIISLGDDWVISYMSRTMFLEKVEEAKQRGLDDDVALIASGRAFIGELKEMGYPHLLYAHDQDSFILPSNKMALSGEEDVLIDMVERVSKNFEGKYWFGRTLPRWCEILLSGTHKGATLSHLLEEINLDAKDVVAFGDGENDIEMLELCGIGVAMGNALDSVKEQADRVADTNNEDGIAKVLEEVMGLK